MKIFVISQVGELPKDSAYVRNVRLSGRFYSLQQDNGYVVPECDASGQVKRGYCLVQKKACTPSSALLMCSCAQAKTQRSRIAELPDSIEEEGFAALVAEEEAEYCVHARAVSHLFGVHSCSAPPDIEPEEENELSVDFLSLEPPLVALYDGRTYGLIGHKRTTKLQCLHCDSRCKHVILFNEWCERNNIHLDHEEPLTDDAAFQCVSSCPIPYPLPSSLQALHDRHEGGKWEFPLHLVPTANMTARCKHGHHFDQGDPVASGWISKRGIAIFKESITIRDAERVAYYRPTTGPCSCRQEYDGQVDLLFNLDGKNMFYYGFLLHYLHLMLEGKNPLIAFLRACKRSFAVQSMTKHDQACQHQTPETGMELVRQATSNRLVTGVPVSCLWAFTQHSHL